MKKDNLDAIKTANKELAKASTNLLIKSVGSTSFFGGLLVKAGLRWARHKGVLRANQKLVELAVKSALTDSKVKKAKSKEELVKLLRDNQW